MILVEIDAVWRRREVFERALLPHEEETYATLRIEKRARDWLAGRIAAKRAIQRELGIPFSRIGIRAAEGGRPTVELDGRSPAQDIFVSIAHSANLAAAVCAPSAVGVDLEIVEARTDSFARTFLGASELAGIDHLAGRERDRALTAMWCRKEAIAKLLGVGLAKPFAELELPRDARLDEGALEHQGRELRWARACR